MNNPDWQQVINFIQTTLNKVQDNLDQETINTVTHYLQHAEYEMAFEGLFLEVMGLGITTGIDINQGKEIAILLKLNEHSVFVVNFWNRFSTYCQLISYTSPNS